MLTALLGAFALKLGNKYPGSVASWRQVCLMTTLDANLYDSDYEHPFTIQAL